VPSAENKGTSLHKYSTAMSARFERVDRGGKGIPVEYLDKCLGDFELGTGNSAPRDVNGFERIGSPPNADPILAFQYTITRPHTGRSI